MTTFTRESATQFRHRWSCASRADSRTNRSHGWMRVRAGAFELRLLCSPFFPRLVRCARGTRGEADGYRVPRAFGLTFCGNWLSPSWTVADTRSYPAMRLYTDPVSRAERAASIAVATAVTVTGALLVLASAQSRVMLMQVPTGTRKADSISERLRYLVTVPTNTIAPAHPTARPSPRAQPPHGPASRARTGASTSSLTKADSVAGASVSPTLAPMRTSVADFDSRWTPQGVSPLLQSDSTTVRSTTATVNAIASGPVWSGASASPRLRSESVRYDSALRVVHDNLAATLTNGSLAHLPLSQPDRDVQERAKALAAIAARAAGVPVVRTMSGGGSIDAPLPFGGPSRKQRERDSVIMAQTNESLARVLRRLDSVTAARTRYQSLAHTGDSSRSSSQP